MRPPRPRRSGRRARARSMSAGRTSRPAGSPSTTAVSPGPCDSPAVVKRKWATAPESTRQVAQPAEAFGAVLVARTGVGEELLERRRVVRLAGRRVVAGRRGLVSGTLV